MSYSDLGLQTVPKETGWGGKRWVDASTQINDEFDREYWSNKNSRGVVFQASETAEKSIAENSIGVVIQASEMVEKSIAEEASWSWQYIRLITGLLAG